MIEGCDCYFERDCDCLVGIQGAGCIVEELVIHRIVLDFVLLPTAPFFVWEIDKWNLINDCCGALELELID